MSSTERAKIYTFYSYKGGVGRSMALANIAELLYRKGLRVLMIDFDLEAPGLEQYFYKSEEPELQKLLCKRGIIDLLFSYKSLRALSDPLPSIECDGPGQKVFSAPTEGSTSNDFPYAVEPLSNFIHNIYPARSTEPGTLSIITAGRRAKEEFISKGESKQQKDEFALYADRVRAFAWDDFYLNLDGELFFDWFREEAIKDVDIVLIDSRTGVAEMSGVCTYQLADVVTMFAAANNQNIDGIKKVAKSLVSNELIKEGRKGRELTLIFVPSRVDLSEKDKLDDLSKRFRAVADRWLPDVLEFETNSFSDLRIPYIPYYSFVEEVAVREVESTVAVELTKAYENICRCFARLDSKVAEKISLRDGSNVGEQQNRTAEKVYQQLTEDEQLAARSLLTRLVRLAQVEEGELKHSPKVAKFTDLTHQQIEVANKFAAHGLLVINQEQKTIGMASESLIENLIRLNEWIKKDREFLLWRQNVQAAIAIWEKNGRSDSDLLPESRLMDTPLWLQTRRHDLSQIETEFLRASVALPENRQRQRRLRVAGYVVGALLVGMLGYYLYKNNQQQNLREARSRQLASNSATLLTREPELSALLAIEAVNVASTSNAHETLKSVLAQSRLVAVMNVGGPVYSAQFSPDGKRIVTGSDFLSRAQIWEEREKNQWQKLITLQGYESAVPSVAFSPTGQIVATANQAGSLILSNVVNGERIGSPLMAISLTGPMFLTEIAWSPDGKLIAGAAEDNSVYVWDVYSRGLVQKLGLFNESVISVAFSPNGQLLAAGSRDSQVRVWSTKTWRETVSLKGHKDSVLSVSFSPDNKFLLTASRDKTALIWRTDNWLEFAELGEHLNAVTKANFSPDGKFIVTASEDNTAIVWDIQSTPRYTVKLRAASGFIYDASFSPDGKLILTGSGDGTARLWEVNPTTNTNVSDPELVSGTCARLTRNMTQEEWRQYMGDEPYRLTCPNLGSPPEK